MASFDSFPSEADRMAQGACDGAGTTGPDYVSSGVHQETSLVRAQTAPNMVARWMGRNPSRIHQFSRDGQSSTTPRRISTWHHTQHRSNTSTRSNLSGSLHSARRPTRAFSPQRFKTILGGNLPTMLPRIPSRAGRRRHQYQSAGSIMIARKGFIEMPFKQYISFNNTHTKVPHASLLLLNA